MLLIAKLTGYLCFFNYFGLIMDDNIFVMNSIFAQ